ncbi:hypothetical protein [Bradyrhizobium sp. STM 3562]|uniref:hypothetical protein n=1 Tax=Bradyrhizobium sp. STM 3562 TaxID=578924 RepID=UPI00388E3501
MADNSNPAVLQPNSFARQMIEGASFERVGLSLVDRLCKLQEHRETESFLREQQLWRTAVDRAQQRAPLKASVPYSDDRPLYWRRLQATAARRQGQPRFKLSAEQAAALESFDRSSCGMFEIDVRAWERAPSIRSRSSIRRTVARQPRGPVQCDTPEDRKQSTMKVA